MPTEHTYSSKPEFHPAYEALLERGFDGAAEALRIMMNEAMRVERMDHLHASPRATRPAPRCCYCSRSLRLTTKRWLLRLPKNAAKYS